MSQEKEVRWFCLVCLNDQSTDVWDNRDRVCPECKAKGRKPKNADL